MEEYRGFLIDNWEHIVVCRNIVNGKVIVKHTTEQAKESIDEYWDVEEIRYL